MKKKTFKRVRLKTRYKERSEASYGTKIISLRKHFLAEPGGGYGPDGLILHGDNLKALEWLKKDPGVVNKVQLVYIDPPYGTQQTFNVDHDRISTISRINDGFIAYQDILTGKKYLDFLKARLVLIKELMSPTGAIYVHIDNKMGHYVKCLMDEIFGQDNFINDITRVKCNPKNFFRKGFGNIKDVILFYSKTKNMLWNESRQKSQVSDHNARYFKKDQDGKAYTTTPLHAPGQTRDGATGRPWRGMLPPKGRHWRYPPTQLEELDNKGLIEWSSTGNPRKKIFLDDVVKNGTKMQDIWYFKDPQNPQYPTEKNMEMLKVIIKASSNPGDIVLDAFCGSGSTLLAANELKRNAIGIDSSDLAIKVCRQRLPALSVMKVPAGVDQYQSRVA